MHTVFCLAVPTMKMRATLTGLAGAGFTGQQVHGIKLQSILIDQAIISSAIHSLAEREPRLFFYLGRLSGLLWEPTYFLVSQSIFSTALTKNNLLKGRIYPHSNLSQTKIHLMWSHCYTTQPFNCYLVKFRNMETIQENSARFH